MEQKKYLLIEKDVLVNLLRDKHRAACIILLLEHLCSKMKIETVLPTDEVCRVLGFDPAHLESARRVRQIKGMVIDGKCYYPVSDLAMLPELWDRAKIMRRINAIPVIGVPEP